jgi:L-fuculose-phosphate aldolase
MAGISFEQFKQEFMDGVDYATDAVSSTVTGAAADARRAKTFIECAHDLVGAGLVTSHGGNLSECDGTNIWITRTGCMLGHLGPSDIMPCGMEASNRDAGASMELVVHRAMYTALARAAQAAGTPFGAWAIVHAHSLYSVFQSLAGDKIVPLDGEGLHVLGTSVPVVAPAQTVASAEAAGLIAPLIEAGARIVVVRGHGPFALAPTLREALRLVSCLEYSSRLLTLTQLAGR